MVFGCGGDRDAEPSARSWARSAAERADVVVVTSDNPRSEDPDAIIAAIVGRSPAGRPATSSSPSRTAAAAIARALAEARPGDVVVIAGKGHETTQTVAGDDAALRRPGRGPRAARRAAR